MTWVPRWPSRTGLASGRSLEANHGFLAADAIRPGELLEDAAAAGIAECLDLLEEGFGGEFRELRQTGQEIVRIRFELGWWPLLWRPDRRTRPTKRSSHCVARDVQPARDGANRKTLPVKGNDIHPLLQFDQLTPPRRLQRISREATSLEVGQFKSARSGSVSHRTRQLLDS
jgi:hypothetical protein